MKKFNFLFVILFLFLFDVIFAQKKSIDKIVAIVDNEIILESELNMQVMQYSLKEKIDPKNPEIRRMILDQLIENQLILAQAKLDSVIVTDEEITQNIEAQIKSLINQYGSEENLIREANMSLNRIRLEFRDDMKKRMLIERSREMKISNTRVSRREVEEFYNNFKDSLPPTQNEIDLYQILVYPKPSDAIKKKTYEFANSILDSIRKGADFGLMAKRYSEHSSGSTGGDLPMVKQRGTFVREFEEAAYSLQIGQVSNVIESPLGFHIIKLMDRKGDAIQVKQILFKIKKTIDDDQVTIDFLKGIKTKVDKGEKFSELAKRYSEDPNTKDYGGFLGRVSTTEIPEELNKIIKDLKPGQISDPQKTQVGNNYCYKILFVEKMVPSHKMTLEQDMTRIEDFAKRNKLMIEYRKWLEEIKKNVYVDIKL